MMVMSEYGGAPVIPDYVAWAIVEAMLAVGLIWASWVVTRSWERMNREEDGGR